MNFYDDKIEAYLTGKLNAADKIALEEGMAKDPLLKNEVELQNDIIESLKNTRRLQLKTRLDSIVVGSTSSGVSSTVKIAASFIAAGLIGAGVYYYSSVLSTKDKTQDQDNTSVTVVENTPAVGLKTDIQDDSKNTTTNESAISENKHAEKKIPSTVVTTTAETNQEIQAKANVPNGVISDTESDRITRDKTIEIPNGGIVETSDRKTGSFDGFDYSDKKDFSYKYYSNKLYLSGDFKDQPYELVEINTPKSKQLYLYYEGKYYELKSNQTKSTRLKEVKDVSVLEQLAKKNK